jgi:hypothetical protein
MRYPQIENLRGVACDSGQMPDPVAVVVHETQGRSFSSAVAHLVTGWDGDKLRIGRLAEDDKQVCHCGGQNYRSIGIEKCGISSWKIPFRMGMKRERLLIGATAWLTARQLHKFSIPPRYLTIRRLSRSNHISECKGWTYHRSCSYAYRTTSHTDTGVPGVTWPHTRFRLYVLYYFHHPEVREYVSFRAVKKWYRRAKARH